ncbi:hypothetical protein V1264_013592 [Littorina saxatilis]|uniref:Uncharacterized protein n=1 Tax=Littorina saxatilis TaxID=31220 RepID=A0AAN9BNH7_9CAEN
MDEDTATRFVSSLVKSIQALCNGYIDFSSSIEVIGHIHLNIDRNLKLNYILTEEVSKSISEDATLFASHSYHSKPPPSVSGIGKDSEGSKRNRRKSHHVPRVDDSEPDPLIISTLPKDIVHASSSSHSGGDDSQTGHFSTLQDSNTSLSMKLERQQATFTHTRDSPDRRKRSTPLSLHNSPSPAAKRNRNSDSNSSSAIQNANFGVIEIKEEPHDDPPVSFGDSATNMAAGQDIQTPDFSNVVMESLDRVGQIEGTQLMASGNVMPMQHHQPFPVMLHASPVVPLSGVQASGFSEPGPSIESLHTPSTSGAFSLAGVSWRISTPFFNTLKYNREDEESVQTQAEVMSLARARPNRAAERQKRYRERLKNDPERLKVVREKEKKRNRESLKKRTAEQKARTNELSRLRVQKYRERKKCAGIPLKKPKSKAGNRLKRENVRLEREKGRLRKQKSRANMTPQQRAAANNKRRQAFARKKLEQMERQLAASPAFTVTSNST